MSSEKSNTWIPILIAIISVCGTITVALINNSRKEDKQVEKVPDPKPPDPEPVDPDAPQFGELSTFCDTLNYFIEQNSKNYNWLKGARLPLSEYDDGYISKLSLLGYPTVIEKVTKGHSAQIELLFTQDFNEATALHDKLLAKFMPCLQNVPHETVSREHRENMRSFNYEFRKEENLISLELMIVTNKVDDSKMSYFVDIVIE